MPELGRRRMCLYSDALKSDCEKGLHLARRHFCEQMNKNPIIRSLLQGMVLKKGFIQLSNKPSLYSVQCHINIYCFLSLL